MDSSERLIFSLLFVVSVVLVLAIAVVVSPLWASMKTALLGFVGKAKFSLWVIMAICLLLVIREYLEQRKPDPDSLSEAGQSEAARHQRNMYIFTIPATIAAILKILLSLLPGFVQELNDLLEQIEVKQQTTGAQ
jgi:hypothetical protein